MVDFLCLMGYVTAERNAHTKVVMRLSRREGGREREREREREMERKRL